MTLFKWQIIWSIKTLTFCTVFFAFTHPGRTFNPYHFNYCHLDCEKGNHTACACGPRGTRQEVTDNIVQFRSDVVRIHNHYRDYVASGNAQKTYKHVPPAANMLALNYDLELEYIARCLASNSFKQIHDACHITHDNQWVGQNLAGSTTHNFTTANVESHVYNQFEEIKSVTAGTIGYFEGTVTSKGHVGHFTQMVWWSTNRIGCARMWNPGLSMEKPQEAAWRNTLICNFGTLRGHRPNTLGKQVYMRGEPCSGCPEHIKCADNTFMSLCGKVLPVPTDPAEPLKDRTTRNKPWQGTMFPAAVITSLLFIR